jgi:hypothetical protein
MCPPGSTPFRIGPATSASFGTDRLCRLVRNTSVVGGLPAVLRSAPSRRRWRFAPLGCVSAIWEGPHHKPGQDADPVSIPEPSQRSAAYPKRSTRTRRDCAERPLDPAECSARRLKSVSCHNGMGIPPEIKEKLFQPFSTTKPTVEGTGLCCRPSRPPSVQRVERPGRAHTLDRSRDEEICYVPALASHLDRAGVV